MHRNARRIITATAASVAAGLPTLGSAMPAAAQFPSRNSSSFGTANAAARQTRGERDTVRNNQLEARLETDRSQYGADRGVEIRLEIENRNDRRYTLSSGRTPLYTISVRDSRNGYAVWTYESRGEYGIRLDGREKRSFRQIWDQRDSRGRQVPGGTYQLEVRVDSVGRMTVPIYLSGDGRRDDDRRDDDRGRWGDRWNNGRPPRPGEGRPGGGWNDDDRGERTDYNSLRYDLDADRRSARPGDRIRFTYTVQNTSRYTQVLRFSSGKQFDVEVRANGGGLVWQSSYDMGYTQSLSEIKLSPGERKTFSVNWQVPRGTREGSYEVQAYLTPRDSGGRAATARYRLRVDD